MTVTRLIITGATGAGKTRLAQELAKSRPDLDVISYDALRLTENWIKRPKHETTSALNNLLDQDAWVVEGGPSLLIYALPHCHGVIWLDPPTLTRAYRLAIRPWTSFGQVRDGLPVGNVDWPIQQYRFALRSLAKSGMHRKTIEHALLTQPRVPVWRCTTNAHISSAVREIFLRQTANPRPFK